jgi:hypothetical protein
MLFTSPTAARALTQELHRQHIPTNTRQKDTPRSGEQTHPPHPDPTIRVTNPWAHRLLRKLSHG